VVNPRTSPLRNLVPADLKKDASGFDLPIALGLLIGSGQVSFVRPGRFAIIDELPGAGETRPIMGILAMALQAVAEGRDGLLVLAANASEAAVVDWLEKDILRHAWARSSFSAVYSPSFDDHGDRHRVCRQTA
jgi:magnesium chelatase family protein